MNRLQSSIQECLDCLYKNDTPIVEFHQLATKKRKKVRTLSSKKALNNNFVKFNLDKHKIIAKPLKNGSEFL